MSEIYNPNSGNVNNPYRAERYFTYVTRSGRTLIARKPAMEPRLKPNGSPKSMQKEIRQAVTYAGFAWEQAIYQSRAVGTSVSAYNLAVADYLGKPEVLRIDLRDWTQGTGQAMHIKARDNFMVLSVRLVIREGDCIIEEGEAVQSKTDGLSWTYTTVTSVARAPGLRLDAFAYDLPGNVGVYHVELR